MREHEAAENEEKINRQEEMWRIYQRKILSMACKDGERCDATQSIEDNKTFSRHPAHDLLHSTLAGCL